MTHEHIAIAIFVGVGIYTTWRLNRADAMCGRAEGWQLTLHQLPASFVGNLLWMGRFYICTHQIIDERSEDRCLGSRQSKSVSYVIKRYFFSQLEEALIATEDGDK